MCICIGWLTRCVARVRIVAQRSLLSALLCQSEPWLNRVEQTPKADFLLRLHGETVVLIGGGMLTIETQVLVLYAFCSIQKAVCITGEALNQKIVFLV